MQNVHEQLRRMNCLIGEMNAVSHEAALKLGLSDSAMMILYTVSVEGGSCPISEIVRQSGMSKQTLNSALRRLEEEGDAYLEADSGRRKRVCLTEAGQAHAAATVQRMIDLEDAILGGWTEQERTMYLNLTQRYLEALRDGVRDFT